MANKAVDFIDGTPSLEVTPSARRFTPKPDKVHMQAPQVEDSQDIDLTILRRVKVRELRNMGYTDVNQIAMILNKGIKLKTDLTVQVDCRTKTIEEDLNYLVQEDVAGDKSYVQKRVELLDRLHYLYQRSFTDYTQSAGPSKNTFLNTAFSILKTIADMEGITAPSNGSDKVDVGSAKPPLVIYLN